MSAQRTSTQRTSTQRLSGDDRRAQIADAALELVAEHGIAALSTGALAKAVGVTTGALFRHFASLDEILVAVAARAADRLATTLPSEELPPRERLERFLVARSTLASSRAGIPRLVLSDQLAAAVPEEARRILLGAVQDTRRFLARTLADGQRGGIFRDDVDPDALAALAMGVLQVTALMSAGRFPRTASAESVRATLMTLLEPTPGAKGNHRGERA